MKKWIGRQLRTIRTGWRTWRHERQLKRQVAAMSPEYADYLQQQLARTLRKDSSQLKARTILLVDKVAELSDLAQAAVLCIGCRNRAEIDYFLSKGARQVVGIDLFSQDPAILVMDMHQMTFPDAAFDVVYSSHSLEHALAPQRVADEIARVGRPGAVVAVEVPVRYEPHGADLVDFGGSAGIHALFGTRLGPVLWQEEAPAGDAGTAVARTVFRLRE